MLETDSQAQVAIPSNSDWKTERLASEFSRARSDGEFNLTAGNPGFAIGINDGT